MSYNLEDLPQFAKTAGRISIAAAVVSFCVFMFALMVDVGNQEIQRVSAQTATTSLTVLNTPPTFLVEPYEVVASATTTPTNSGDVIQWSAVGSDANGADYYLIVCSADVAPIPGVGGAPDCGAGAIQWGVSTATVSDTPAIVSTTTVEFADDAGTQFSEVNDWFAWVCDGDTVQPECTILASQGTTTGDDAPPFHMNQRPVFTNVGDGGGADPGTDLTFTSTSSDPDTVGGPDLLTLVVCASDADYSTTTNSCVSPLTSIASSSTPVNPDPVASTTLPSPYQDGVYNASAIVVDEHGLEASAPISVSFTVNNVAPTILGSNILLNGGNDLVLTEPGAETLGYTLDFTASDGNSCINFSGATSSEIVGFELAIHRSGVATSTCDPAAGAYDPNNCYTSGVAAATWNLACTASTTSCTGVTDATQEFNCSFPLWFVADATDLGGTNASPFAAENWIASVAPADDNFATSSLVSGDIGVELLQFSALDLLTAEIPYGALAPGEGYTNLGGAAGTTTSQVLNLGNTGIDQEVRGESMCPDFSIGTPCGGPSSSTIPASLQEFDATQVAYGSGLSLSSTTETELELNVNKATTTATSTVPLGTTYWGIYVPGGADAFPIQVAGSYEGLNTFTAVVAETLDW